MLTLLVFSGSNGQLNAVQGFRYGPLLGWWEWLFLVVLYLLLFFFSVVAPVLLAVFTFLREFEPQVAAIGSFFGNLREKLLGEQLFLARCTSCGSLRVFSCRPCGHCRRPVCSRDVEHGVCAPCRAKCDHIIVASENDTSSLIVSQTLGPIEASGATPEEALLKLRSLAAAAGADAVVGLTVRVGQKVTVVAGMLAKISLDSA